MTDLDIVNIFLITYPNSGLFWNKIYNKYTKICSFCNTTIKYYEDLITLNCNVCKDSYHDYCYSNEKCISCDDTKKKYVNFFHKELDDKYIKIYHDTVGKLDTDILRICFYNFWFEKSFTDYEYNILCNVDYNHTESLILLNPYDYDVTVDIERFKKNIEYSIKSNYVFDIDNINIDFGIIDINSKSKIDFSKISLKDGFHSRSLNSLQHFKENLIFYSYGLINNDFPWQLGSIYLVGQSVQICLDKNIEIPNDDYNIELLIANTNIDELKDRFNKVVSYYQKKYNDDIFWILNHHIIYIYIKGFKRCIQITLINNKLENIINNLEFTSCQFAYDGKNISSSINGIRYLCSGISYYISTSKNTNLYSEQKKLGVLIAYKYSKRSIILDILNGYKKWYPGYFDNLNDVKHFLSNEYKINSKYITQSKHHRLYDKQIPTRYQQSSIS